MGDLPGHLRLRYWLYSPPHHHPASGDHLPNKRPALGGTKTDSWGDVTATEISQKAMHIKAKMVISSWQELRGEGGSHSDGTARISRELANSPLYTYLWLHMA